MITLKPVILALVFASALTVPLSAGMIDPAALHGKKLLFVTGEATKAKPNEDGLVEEHLKALGFVVIRAKDSDSDHAAAGQDLVVISSSVEPEVLQGAYRDLPVPVLTWSAYSYPYLAMTGPDLHKDYELIDPIRFPARTFTALYGWCTNPVNPIIKAVGLTRSQNFGTFYLLSTEVAWGRPSAGGTVVASIEGRDDGEAVLFTYERGAQMCDHVVAPARRVGFFLSANNFHLLSQAYGPGENDRRTREWYIGLKLFDASLRWAVSPPPPQPQHDPAVLHAALARAAAGKKVLFVGRKHAFEGREADAHMIAYLTDLGFKVTFADQDDSDGLAEGQDLVMISATCSKYKLANRYTDVTQPFIEFDPLMADSYGMTGRERYAQFGVHGEPGESVDPSTSYINIVGSWSALAAGLPSGPVRMINEPDIIGFGEPGRAAIVIANFSTNPEQCPIFAYEKGATLANGRVNPNRRVFFALDNNAFDDLTAEGHQLWDAAVLWALSAPKH
ncbi:MAG: hypothetical protein ACHQ4G_10760 [Opitutales bacterium]